MDNRSQNTNNLIIVSATKLQLTLIGYSILCLLHVTVFLPQFVSCYNAPSNFFPAGYTCRLDFPIREPVYRGREVTQFL